MAKATYKHTLRWDITRLKAKETVLDVFPELAAYDVFAEHGSGDNDCWLRFGLLYADKGSALQNIGDLDRKKREAMRLAGIDAESERAQDVLKWQDADVVAIVAQVVRVMNSRKYTAWFHGSEHYNRSFEVMPSNPGETGGRDFGLMLTEGDQLDELEKVLFMGEEALANAHKEASLQKSGTLARRSENETFTEHDDDEGS